MSEEEVLREQVADLQKQLRDALRREDMLHLRLEHLFDAFSERNSRLLKRLQAYENGEARGKS